MKANWKYKKRINILISKLVKFPFIAKLVTRIVYTFRYLLKRGNPAFSDYLCGIHVNSKRNYAYVSIPKVGTTTILRHLRKVDDTSLKQFKINLDELEKSKLIDSNSFCFSVTRNPWARIYSCWFDKISGQKRFCDFFIISRYKNLYPGMPFREFLEWLQTEEGGDSFADRHWISQHVLLENAKGKERFNFLGKIESFDEDFTTILDFLKIEDKNFEKANSLSNSPSQSYRQFYDDYQKELVAKRYSEDIAQFGYRF
ncbi:sulfotransferase family 2 domain-containing protein [Glaciecola sp. 1036]|uniref:sulfotransferase family 2 domain-containing protein n=1 Tax=Alteromonadaceae TaxID=72275 RepID=UPI003D020FC6